MVENPLVTALIICAIGIVLLILALSAFAGIVMLLTGWIKAKPEEEEEEEETPAEVVEAAAPATDSSKKLRAAAIAVALARAQAEYGLSQTDSNRHVEQGSWWQYHQSRQLSQSVKVRRSS
jgi:Na+-transporting methylmalonyl-CoA/oxaloacetate decarboxylase gamma subunit